MSLSKTWLAALEASLGPIVQATPVGGGDISQAVRLRLAGGETVLVKWQTRPVPGLFTAEQQGLELLRSAGVLRVPRVLACHEATTTVPAFIALEWLDTTAKSAHSATALGHGLAALHRHTAARFGLDHDNFIGANPQPNRPTTDWVTFFREQRLGFQMELARRNGFLSKARAQRLEQLLARLEEWLPAQPPASLLHGDLWGGNWLTTAAAEPVLIDPAVYYGHREAELAFTELFGGFPNAFYAAYHETWPLDPGYTERKELYNLYHLMNHLNLFGEGYGGSVDAVLRRYSS
jgi:fructosamine-3-kinase